MKGCEILMKSLLAHGVDTIFGYPGGQIIPVYDALHDYSDRLHHILVRHEQGAIHAAQGYARVKGTPGVIMVTSGPGATNVITGVADAMIDSTPVIVIAGQVSTDYLGTDSFQETDLIGLTTPITKWSYQIRRPEDISKAVARAFFIASTGRPGPVVLDLTKDAQIGEANYQEQICNFIRSYVPRPVPDGKALEQAASMINSAERPFLVYGQGIILSGAEKALEVFLEKTDIPAASTLLGLSALDCDNPHYKGMLGMHGNLLPNVLTTRCDLLIAVGMRFDDRVTGDFGSYARQAKIIHIDIDESEIGKLIPVDLGIKADAKDALERLATMIAPKPRTKWNNLGGDIIRTEMNEVIIPETRPSGGPVNPGEVVSEVSKKCSTDAVIVTDVGQNQMLAARYSKFHSSRSFISSGGLGTMGFGLPAAIGAKTGAPGRQVIAFLGDGGFQMTMQELGTIMQEGTGVKIVILDNSSLGNVRQLQKLFFNGKCSFTDIGNPDFEAIAKAYGIRCETVADRESLSGSVERMLSDDRPFILNVKVREGNMVFPMIPPGKSLDRIMLNNEKWFEYGC